MVGEAAPPTGQRAWSEAADPRSPTASRGALVSQPGPYSRISTHQRGVAAHLLGQSGCSLPHHTQHPTYSSLWITKEKWWFHLEITSTNFQLLFCNLGVVLNTVIIQRGRFCSFLRTATITRFHIWLLRSQNINKLYVKKQCCFGNSLAV